MRSAATRRSIYVRVQVLLRAERSNCVSKNANPLEGEHDNGSRGGEHEHKADHKVE